jgi:hypothetical protein
VPVPAGKSLSAIHNLKGIIPILPLAAYLAKSRKLAQAAYRHFAIRKMQTSHARLAQALTKRDEINPMRKVDERVTVSLNLGDTLIAMPLIG